MKDTADPRKPSDPNARARAAALELLAYCRAHGWAGYDPYDALNSRVYRSLPFLNFRLARLALTQGIKRSPVNLRPLLLVPRTLNPKGLALFLSSLARLTDNGTIDGRADITWLGQRLLELRSGGRPYACWGYNFSWQQRFELVPKGSPNIICTTFAANALLDAEPWAPSPAWRETALEAAQFLLRDLLIREGSRESWFRYTLVGREKVHNANLLGAAFIGRIGRLTGDRSCIETALEAARFSLARQREDGSWAYGEAPTQMWIDNFHTGFNLVALKRLRRYAGTSEFDPSIRKGFAFFRDRFIRPDGAPKYFPDDDGSIDIHSAAQSIITLTEFADLDPDSTALASKVLDWTLENLRSSRGFFYYQKKRHYTVRTSFMRWSQAWMLLALSTLLSNNGPDDI